MSFNEVLHKIQMLAYWLLIDGLQALRTLLLLSQVFHVLILLHLPLWNKTRVEDVLGSRIEFSTFNCSELSYPCWHAIKKVNVHVVILKFRAIRVYKFVVRNVDFYLNVVFHTLFFVNNHCHLLGRLFLNVHQELRVS